MPRLLLTVCLALYNNLANQFPAFNGWIYVPVNLVVTALVLGVAVGPLGLSRAALGLASIEVDDVVLGIVLGAALALPLLAALAHPRTTRLLADRRVGTLRGVALAYQALVRVPLGTVLLEEIAFRGVLFAAWREEGTLVAAVISAATFGCWHVAPAFNLVDANRPAAAAWVRLGSVATAVVATLLAGLALVWLRIASGGLTAPFALHSTLNALATVAGAVAYRRVNPPSPRS